MGSTHATHEGRLMPHEPYQRRKLIAEEAQKYTSIDSDIKVYCEYVEGPRGNVIYTKCFFPKTKQPKGLICQCPGYTDYSDYIFMGAGQEYAKQGYIFFVWDQQGHGRSSGLWIDFNIGNLMKDTMFICNYARKKYKYPNNYLFGTSMGGNIVSRIIMDCEQKQKNFHKEWNGFVLFSPMIGIDDSKKLHPLVMYCIGYLKEWFPKSIILTGEENTKRSRDKRKSSFLRKNPLAFPFKPRPGVGVNLLESAEFVQRKENAQWIGKANVPLLVLHGSGDNVTTHEKSLKMVDEVKEIAEDATHKTFDGAYHALMEDSCRFECRDTVVEWMAEHNHKRLQMSG